MGWLGNLVRGKPEADDAVVRQVTDQSFAELLEQADKPVMLFLWGGSCPYCRKMAPNVKAVAERHRARLIAAHANASEVPAIAQALDLRGVPATVFFHARRPVAFVPGFKPEAYLDEVIAKLPAGDAAER